MVTEELTRGKRLGRYELLQRIGRGGMATVWVAREHADTPEQERLVAVKAILHDLASDKEFVDMFLDEGRLIRAIRHPNVVDVYEVDDADGVMFMAMEWVEGDSLHAVIAESGKRRPIPPEMAVRIIADAAAGLHAAHELTDENGKLLGVVHRDVSPHNILIGTDGAIKLVDFGVAKAMGRIGEATQAGQLKGKFGYMSPEQARGKPVDRRADIFALGIVLFELTTTRRLFRGEHDAETLHLVVSGKIPEPRSIDPEYPEELQRIVLRALERDIEKRYQTAREFQEDLEAYLQANRILVPHSGVGSLLKRVLGARIEQRRKGIRAVLKAAESGSHGLLPGGEAGFTPTGKSSADVISEGTGSGIGPASVSSITGSGVGFPMESSAPTHTGFPQTVSTPPPQRSGLGGYIVGVVGLLVALVVVVIFAVTRRETTTTTVVSVPAATAPPVETQKPETPTPAATNDGVETLELDQLDAGATEPEAPATAGHSQAPRTAPKATTAPKSTGAATPSPTGDLPRANPYK